MPDTGIPIGTDERVAADCLEQCSRIQNDMHTQTHRRVWKVHFAGGDHNDGCTTLPLEVDRVSDKTFELAAEANVSNHCCSSVDDAFLSSALPAPA